MRSTSLALGRMQSKHGHGEGSSPTLIGNTLIVNWDHEEQSFVAAFDTQTGKQKWEKSRTEKTSWASPVAFHFEGKGQVLVSGTQLIRCYDVDNGDLIWQCRGLSANVVATPVVHDGFAWLGSSYDTRALMAISLKGAKGDISNSNHIAWSRKKRTPYVPSPLLYKDTLYYFFHYQPILSRVIAKTGEDLPGPLRLNELHSLYASPVAAANRIYLTDLSDTTLVISQLERRFKKLFKITPLKYINQVRLHAAAQLLTSTEESLGSIASDCGFYDQSHFTHQFKKAHGISPYNTGKNAPTTPCTHHLRAYEYAAHFCAELLIKVEKASAIRRYPSSFGCTKSLLREASDNTSLIVSPS